MAWNTVRSGNSYFYALDTNDILCSNKGLLPLKGWHHHYAHRHY